MSVNDSILLEKLFYTRNYPMIFLYNLPILSPILESG